VSDAAVAWGREMAKAARTLDDSLQAAQQAGETGDHAAARAANVETGAALTALRSAAYEFRKRVGE
jgi:hypothetical protein